MSRPPLVTRLVLRNYKSVKACDVSLPRLAFLVGPNGAGKSNVLDSLRFVADALRTTLDHALRDRGGIKEVRRSSTGHPTHVGVRLEFRLSSTQRGCFAFDLGARRSGAYAVQREECEIIDDEHRSRHAYVVEDGVVESSTLEPTPAAAADRLYLVSVSGAPGFRRTYEALSNMGFYNLNPAAIRELQPPDPGHLLARDGSNIASVLESLTSERPEVKARVEEYLGKVVPGIVGVDARHIGPRETVQFRQRTGAAQEPRRFLAASMSDGTLRALGVLVALYQAVGESGDDARLIGIEEPEVALHPAAAGVLMGGIADASEYSQVLITSHSPDLLDHESIDPAAVFAVVSEGGNTAIGSLDEAGVSALKQGLYSAGELLRMDQLRPNDQAVSLEPEQLQLFGGVVPA